MPHVSIGGHCTALLSIALLTLAHPPARSMAQNSGHVQILSYTSNLATNPDRKLAVYLPPNYTESSAPLPVLYLLHGAGGNHLSWVANAPMPGAIDRLLQEGKIRPLIIVMPMGDLIIPASEENTGDNADLLIQDLEINIMPLVKSQFRISDARCDTAIAGNSKGARQSSYILLRRPEWFGAAGMFSIGRYPPLTPDGEEGALANQIGAKGLTFKPLVISCGVDEPTYRTTGETFASMIDFQPTEITESSAGNGGHEWAVWLDVLENKFLPDWVGLVSFDAWAGTHISGPHRTTQEDPDQDGVSNLMEFAMGTDPDSALSMPRPVIANFDEGRVCRLVYRRAKSSAVHINYEKSTDLITWQETTATETILVPDTDDNVQTMAADFATEGNHQFFVRTRITSY